jgi:hypothetical protein
VIHAPETPRPVADYLAELKMVSENAMVWARTIEGAILQHVSSLPEELTSNPVSQEEVPALDYRSLNNSSNSNANDPPLSNSAILPPPDYTLPTIVSSPSPPPPEMDAVPIFLAPSQQQGHHPVPVYTMPAPTPIVMDNSNSNSSHNNMHSNISSVPVPAYAMPAPSAVVLENNNNIIVGGDTLNLIADEAESLLLQILSSSGPESRNALLKEHKKLMERTAKARERATEPLEVQRWTELLRHIEHNVVFSPSLHDAIIKLEQQFYELVERRGQLGGRHENVRAASDLRRDVIGLRKILRRIKEESLGQSEENDPALIADLNRVTDLQENASQLELEIETNFEIDRSMEDIVNERRKETAIKQAVKAHEMAENDIFDL